MPTRELYQHIADKELIVYIDSYKLVDVILITRHKGTKFAVSRRDFKAFYKPYKG